MTNFLLTFLITSQLLLHTCSEWVEISQQHYRRKPEDFFETASLKPAVTKADVSGVKKGPVLEIDKEDSARIKGAILSVSDSRIKKGNVYKITNLGFTEKGHQEVTSFNDSDELNFSSKDKSDASVSDLQKGEIEKTTVVSLRKDSNGERKPDPVSNNRFDSKGHANLSPSGNKIVRLTTNKNSQTNNVQTSEKVVIKNSENVKALSSMKNQNRKPTQYLSGQRYESYEIKDHEKNKYVFKPQGAQETSASNMQTKDKIVLHNLDDVMPQLTTHIPIKPTTTSLEDVFNVQTEEYPYIDVIHDFDEIPNRKVDSIDSDAYTLEADEISDVKLIVRKPAQKNKHKNPRIDNTKNPNLGADSNIDKTISKKQYHTNSYANSELANDNSNRQSSSEIKNDKIPFERLDVTKITEPPDPGFVTKHDIIEEGFIIDDNRSENSGQEDSEGIIDSQSFEDDVTVTTEKTDHEPVQGAGTSINSTKLNPIANVMKVVKYVAETISKNTRKGFRSKINYLNKLKTSLMSNIVSKIEALWPDDDARSHRKAREARGHVEFPSSEGALMSISFLTFAVFLIKLVMQLIQTFRNNNPQFVAPAGAVLVSRAASAISQRAGRLAGD